MTVYALRVPGRFYFAPAALMGFTLRSFLLRKGIPPVSEQDNPPTVSPACIPFAEASGRLAGRSSWVFRLFKVPGGSHVFSTSTAGCSLGFFAFEGPSRKPWLGFRPTSSHALSIQPKPDGGASESRSVFASASSSVYINANGSTRPPLEAFCTNRLPSIQAKPIRAMCSPRADTTHFYAATNALWIGALPYRSCWEGL